MIPLVTVWPHRAVTGWDGDANASVDLMPSGVPLAEALAARYESDAHVWPGIVREGGAVSQRIPRLNLRALPVLAAAGARVLYGSVWIDVDDPVAHAAKTPARDLWRQLTEDGIARLPADLAAGLGWYATRGGIRMVWALGREVVEAEYLATGRALRDKLAALGFDRVDHAAEGAVRCFRLPDVLRDGRRQEWPTRLERLGAAPLPPLEAPSPRVPRAPDAPPASPFEAIAQARLPFQLPPLVVDGTRNTTATQYAGQLRHQGLDEPAILAALLDEVEHPRWGGWEPSPGELEGIARSVARYPTPPPPVPSAFGAPPPVPGVTPPAAKPVIKVRVGEVPRQVDELEAALLAHGGMYQRTLRVVQVQRDPSGRGRLIIHPVERDALRDRAARVADWRAWKVTKGPPGVLGADSGEWVPCNVPADVVAQLVAKGSWTFPPLVGISETPVVRPDGTIWATPGWDAATGYLYDPGKLAVPSIPDVPTQAEARAALRQLAELFEEFPFAGEVDRAVALAAVLTCVARSAMPTAPLTICDGHTPASGKTLIAKVCSILATGEEISAMSETNDEELEKRITAMLRSGAPVILMDNVTRPVGGSSLDALLTSSWWKGRVLGATEMVELPNVASWFVSGNNVAVRGDMVRRALRCFIDTPDERPEFRAYRIGDLSAYVREHRGRLVAAAVTVIRARAVSQDPRPRPLGSFGEWSRIVRDALVWLGLPDPVESQDALRATADLGLAAFQELMAAWLGHFARLPLQVTDALEQLERESGRPSAKRLIRSIEELTELRLSDPKVAKLLAYQIRQRQGRTIGGLAFVADGRSKAGRRWIVREVSR